MFVSVYPKNNLSSSKGNFLAVPLLLFGNERFATVEDRVKERQRLRDGENEE